MSGSFEKSDLKTIQDPVFVSEKFDGSSRLRVFEFVVTLLKENYRKFIFLPILFGILAVLIFPYILKQKHSYQIMLKMPKSGLSKLQVKQTNDSGNIHAIVPDLDPSQLITTYKSKDVFNFIQSLGSGKVLSSDNSKIIVKSINKKSDSDFVIVTLIGGPDLDFDKFADDMVRKVNGSFFASSNSDVDLVERERFLKSTIIKLEAMMADIESALKDYGFSAILLKEKNTLLPRISYMKGLLVKKFSDSSKNIGQKVSLFKKGPVSKKPVFPNMVFIFVAGFAVGIVLALLLFTLKNAKTILNFLKNHIQFKINYYENLTFEEKSSGSIKERVLKKGDIGKNYFLYKRVLNLERKAFDLMQIADEGGLSKLFNGWAKGDVFSQCKLICLSKVWWVYGRGKKFVSFVIPDDMITLCKQTSQLSTEQNIEVLEEAINEISGLMSFGAKNFFPLFSGLSLLSPNQIKEFNEFLDENEFAILYFSLSEKQKEGVDSILDSHQKEELQNTVFELPENVEMSVFLNIESKLDDYVDSKKSFDGQDDQNKTTSYLKTYMLKSLKPVKLIEFVNSSLEEDPDLILWYAKNYINVGLIPYFKKTIILKASSMLNTDEFFKVFGFFGLEFLQELIDLKEGVKQQILKDEVERIENIEDIGNESALFDWFSLFLKEYEVTIKNSPEKLFDIELDFMGNEAA